MSSESAWNRLTEIVAYEGATFDTAFLRQSGWEGVLPKACVCPATQEEVCAVLRLAQAEKWRVAPAGNFTKQRMAGTPQDIDLVISLRRLNRITDYQPADLTVTVEAGLAMEAIAAALGAQGQMLPLDAPFTAAGATVGGVMAANSSGPRRLGYGSARDMAIGVQFVTSDGMLVKSGGKVVKNVAGYDMIKLLIGSFGTLGIITGATFKVFPVARASASFVLGFSTLRQVLEARNRILNSALIPQALDFVDSTAAAWLQEDALSESPFSLVAGVAGPEPLVERVGRDLPRLVHADGVKTVSRLTDEAERTLWSAIRELTPSVLAGCPDAAVVKASVPLMQVGDLIERAKDIASNNRLATATLARAGSGIVYCHFLPDSDTDNASRIERSCKACESLSTEAAGLGGSAVIEWCPSELKEKISLWEPTGDDFTVMRRLKAQLDPAGILNPGRLYAKI